MYIIEGEKITKTSDSDYEKEKIMKKPLASILTAALLLSALTGCSNGAESSDESSVSSVSESTSSSPAASSSTSSTVESTSSAAPETPAIDEDFVVPHSEIKLNLFKDGEKSKDFAQAIDLINQYAYLQFTVIHPNEKDKSDDPVYLITDKEQSIQKEIDDNPYWFYKVIKGEMSSEKLFNEKLDNIFTEKFKKEFLEYNKNDLIVSDGFIYLNVRMKRVGAIGAGMSYVELNSFEYTDENTILLTATNVGDKDEWGLEEDLREAITVKFVKNSDGKLRIDEISDPLKASIAFGYYDSLYCGNFTR